MSLLNMYMRLLRYERIKEHKAKEQNNILALQFSNSHVHETHCQKICTINQELVYGPNDIF